MELLKTGTDCKTENLCCRKSTNVIEFTIYYWNTFTKEKKKKRKSIRSWDKPYFSPGRIYANYWMFGTDILDFLNSEIHPFHLLFISQSALIKVSTGRTDV